MYCSIMYFPASHMIVLLLSSLVVTVIVVRVLVCRMCNVMVKCERACVRVYVRACMCLIQRVYGTCILCIVNVNRPNCKALYI